MDDGDSLIVAFTVALVVFVGLALYFFRDSIGATVIHLVMGGW